MNCRMPPVWQALTRANRENSRRSEAVVFRSCAKWLGSDLLFDFFEGFSFGFRGIVFVEGIAAADEAIAGSGGAIAERAADCFRIHYALVDRVGENRWIGESHAAKADKVDGALAN